MDPLDQAIQNFYRAPEPGPLLAAVDGFLAAPTPSLIVVAALARMAMVSPEVRRGLEARRSVQPRFIDAVLRGFDDPQFPRVGDGPPSPEELDLLWVEFFVTGASAPLLRVVGVLDEPDLVRAKLEAWLRELGTGFFARRTFERFAPVFERCAFPVRFADSRVDGPVDLDLSVALTARAGKLKFAELPFPLTAPELVRIAAKSAAVWSLRDLSTRHERVAAVCREAARAPGGAARRLLDV